MNARESIREATKEMLLDNNIGTNEWSESNWPSGYYGWISSAMILDLIKEYDVMKAALEEIIAEKFVFSGEWFDIASAALKGSPTKIEGGE